MGRLCTVEGDAWFLPDTVGVSYGTDHVKTTIVPAAIDRAGRSLGYFHNAGYYELAGDDFDGLLRLGAHGDPDALPPYVERIRLDRVRRDDPDLVGRVVGLTRDHLARRPADNPVIRMAARLAATCPGSLPRTSNPSTSTRSACAVSVAPAPSWPPPSSTG